jgi:hypothetical protein
MVFYKNPAFKLGSLLKKESDMLTQKEKFEKFIHDIYEEDEEYSKEEIMSKVEKAPFAPDMQSFFEQIEDKNYDKESLIGALNAKIEARDRIQVVGGKIENK